MNRAEIRALLEEEHFTPFVLATKGGFALAIGPEERKHTLAGAVTIVVMDAEGHFIHLPYQAIDHLEIRRE
jgi:hypothetical protein